MANFSLLYAKITAFNYPIDCNLDEFYFYFAPSLAASLLPSDSAANAAGFGGFIGSYRLDSSLAGDDAAPFSVWLFGLRVDT